MKINFDIYIILITSFFKIYFSIYAGVEKWLSFIDTQSGNRKLNDSIDFEVMLYNQKSVVLTC